MHMDDRRLGLLGVIAPLLFTVSMAVLGAIRPGYSHVTRATSELGALGTPAMLAWNILGFGLPGLLLTIFGWQLGLHGRAPSFIDRATALLLASLGASLLLSGLLPADLANLRSLPSQLHIAASLIGLLWIPGVFIWAVRQFGRWRSASMISALAGLLFIAAMVLDDLVQGGLAQRIRFGIVLGWALWIGLLLLGRARGRSVAPHQRKASH
jgi:hypothetical membrane protein